jgi:AcrR family transcriptional regulator
VEILRAAQRLLAKAGLKGFSLEAVAREAGVAASLPRHYFGGTYDLMKATTEDILKEVENVLLGQKPELPLRSRFASYLEILGRAPWGHEVWVRARELHPSLNSIVHKSRRRMMETMYGRPWNALSSREQIDARGRIGYIEAVVSDWLDQGMKDSEPVLEALVRTARV